MCYGVVRDVAISIEIKQEIPLKSGTLLNAQSTPVSVYTEKTIQLYLHTVPHNKRTGAP